MSHHSLCCFVSSLLLPVASASRCIWPCDRCASWLRGFIVSHNPNESLPSGEGVCLISESDIQRLRHRSSKQPIGRVTRAPLPRMAVRPRNIHLSGLNHDKVFNYFPTQEKHCDAEHHTSNMSSRQRSSQSWSSGKEVLQLHQFMNARIQSPQVQAISPACDASNTVEPVCSSALPDDVTLTGLWEPQSQLQPWVRGSYFLQQQFLIPIRIIYIYTYSAIISELALL